MQAEKRSPGRPALPKGIALTKQVKVCMNKQQTEQVHKAAALEGLSIGEWIRQTIQMRLES